MIDKLIELLKGLPPYAAVLVVIFISIILLLTNVSKILDFLKFVILRKPKKHKRGCGDCLIILFSIREKYEFVRRRLKNDAAKGQMQFAENKLREVLFFLIQSFSEDMVLLGKEASNESRVMESSLYCEALKNGMLVVKDEIRRSFKENGFHDSTGAEYTNYIKNQTKSLVSMVRSYLKQYYIETDNTIVRLSERFARMDNEHSMKFESWVFDIYNNAKALRKDLMKKTKDIDDEFKAEIDDFVVKGVINKDTECKIN